jgi:hypothetical protein
MRAGHGKTRFYRSPKLDCDACPGEDHLRPSAPHRVIFESRPGALQAR